MRSLAALAALVGTTLATADFLQSPAPLMDEPAPFKWPNATIPFAETLSCETCVRGGYDYCIFRTFPSQTVHGMKRNCTSYPITPEINSVSNVNETDRWVCSLAFKDEVNAIINTCGAYISTNREKQCGDYLIDLNGKKRDATMSIVGLPLWGSCTYRVHTKCGFPTMKYNSESDITGEFDIAYTSYDDYTIDDDINSWEFNQKSSFAGLIVSKNENTTLVVPGTVEHSEYEDCSSKDRNLYLTVTRVKVNTPAEPEVPSSDNITTPEQRRLLQSGDELSNIYFTFSISALALSALAF
ncbi:hypothetical protein FGO68_gene9754 [Halteria grandinella]|uniref:Uncharacterized protein n=1 Tax=Halteria grandinella TaxID=5974 RepID=A0A8J8NL72_HALGN|nr:hypothetical protein FGO68_gene9754 [Halteria grandinella]